MIQRLCLTDNNMQRTKTSYSNEGFSGQSSSHPKREILSVNQPTRIPLSDKQYASQFMQSFMNISFLMAEATTQGSKLQHFPLANHLSGHSTSNKGSAMHKNYFETIRKKTQQNDVTTGTSQTFIDEESQYQNYLKEYETLVKNSRSKVFVSPMAHKQEVDELIAEFLSDMQQSDIKTSVQSPKNFKNQEKQKLQKDKRQEKMHNPSQIVKMQKIDLKKLKANPKNNASNNRNNIKDEKTQQKQAFKRKQQSRVSRQPQTVVEFQILSPQFTNAMKNQKKRVQRRSTPTVKPRSKSGGKSSIEVINLGDLRKRKVEEKQKQINSTAKNQYLQARQNERYEILKQQHSYLKQNFYKIAKAEQKRILPQKLKLQSQCLKQKAQNPTKKPLKIQIQIVSQSQQERKETVPKLDEQKDEIIKLISKKVINMIQDTKKIGSNPGK